MSRVHGLAAVCRYEFLMQVRKRSLWLVMGSLAMLMPLVQGRAGNPWFLPDEVSGRRVMTLWAVMFGVLMPIAFGSMLADRVVRDDRLGTVGLLDSLPVRASARLGGKYLGGLTSTGLPILAAMLAAGGYESVHRGSVALLGWSLVAFALVCLPGLILVCGFAVTVPMLVSAPLFRVLFVGYWVWASLVGIQVVPSTSGTLLAPIGSYAASWLAQQSMLYVGSDGWLSLLRPDPTATAAVTSIILLVTAGLVPVLLAARLTTRRQLTGK